MADNSSLLQAYNDYCEEEFGNEQEDALPFENDELGIAYTDYYCERLQIEIPIQVSWNRKEELLKTYINDELKITEKYNADELAALLTLGYDAIISDGLCLAEELYGEEEKE